MQFVEISVRVPQERLPEFYRVVGTWLANGSPAERASRQTPPPRPARSKYATLHDHLLVSPRSARRMPFPRLEEVLGFKLPASARKYTAWWANTASHPQGAAWVSAGWRVDGVDLEQQAVTFRPA